MGRIRKTRVFSYVMISALLSSLIAPLAGISPIANAQTSVQPVEMPFFNTDYARVFQNADGTVSSKIYFAPVNYKDTTGNFRHINTDLVSNGNGGYAVHENRFDTTFSGTANAPTLQTVKYQGKQVSFSLVPTSVAQQINSHVLSNPQAGTSQIDHNQINFNGVYPNVSLKEEVTSLGVKESIVLSKYMPGQNSFAFVLNTNGVTPRIAADGSVEFVDQNGQTVFFIPHGVMQDSNVDPNSGNPVQSNAVTYQLKSVQGQTVLVVSVDESWLADSSRIYPVYIDPPINIKSQLTHRCLRVQFESDHQLQWYVRFI